MALLDAPHPRDITDEQWNFIGPFLPELARRKDGRGRPCEVLAQALLDEGYLDLQETFIDGSFAPPSREEPP